MSENQNTAEEVLANISSQNIPTQSALESLGDCLPTASHVQSKIIEFSDLLKGSYRLALLNCGQSERNNLIYLLISLKKSIKLALEQVGKSLRNQEYQFSCGLCGEDILISPNNDIWSSLQDHEHFEELYYQFLNNKLEIKALAEEVNVPTTSESESNNLVEEATTTGDSNTDSGIEQQEMEPSTSGAQWPNSIFTKEDIRSDDNVNNFRFNFNLSYDEKVESKIYPSGIMLGIRRYDKVKEYTIMRVGNTKAACFICHCEMNNMRISKHTLVNHAMGQRHLKAATDRHILQDLQFYHEFWLKQEPPLQAHQVYFRPAFVPNLRCALCGPTFHYNKVIPHINSDPHKKKVLDMYEKEINLYLLVSLQVQVYGITQEQVDRRENERQLKEEAEAKERRVRKNSDSDTADEAKKSASKPHGITHNIIASIPSIESTNPINLLPNRMKEDAKFFKVARSSSTVIIQCDLCKCNVDYKLEAVKNHIISSTAHQALKKGGYKFFCEICNVQVPSEKDWLKHNFSGPRHINMAASRKANVKEHECTTCKTILFGDELSLTRHLAVGNRVNRRERGTRLPDPVKKLFQTKEHILSQAVLLTDAAEDVHTNSLTQGCCLRLESALSEFFEGCKVYPFGSRISGLGNKDSDLDVFVDIGGMYYGEKNQDPTEQVMIIRKAFKPFSKNKEYYNIVQVLTARTPILKLHHVPTKLDCDLSFKHGLSVENTKFLRFCLKLQPVGQQLILLVKKWAEYICFENITTYSLAILCIFYLQVGGYLLSVKQIRERSNVEPRPIGGWKTINYNLSVDEAKTHVKAYTGSVFDLLQEFFKCYSRFDFNSYVVCPLLGRVVKRSLFSEGSPEDLPPEMDAYVAQLQGDDPEPFRSNSYMCIQDPFDLSHNLTKAAQQGTLTRFQTLCKLSLSHLETLK